MKICCLSRTAVCGALIFTLLGSTCLGQSRRRGGGRWLERERAGLAQPFKGVTTDGQVVPGLFEIRATGVDTAPLRKAVQTFLAGLSAAQRAQATFAIDSDEWRKWGNVHSYARDGVSFEELTEEQREAAHGLFKACLSAKGVRKTMDIMKLNETLAELTGRHDEYSRWMYYLSFMGDPSAEGPWGWQLDGHHCIINYFVLGDQVVMAPVFVGSEPVRAKGGKYEGTVIMQAEQDKALAFVQSLRQEQRGQAILAADKSRNFNQLEMFRDNEVVPYAGIRATELDAAQQAKLLDLIGEFVGNLRDVHARVKMAEVRKHLAETRFAWVGGTEDDSVFYYRIHSPVIIIEFDHQQPIALGRRGSAPTRDHIHAVIRTPNGNDYGKDLLRQHLARSHRQQ